MLVLIPQGRNVSVERCCGSLMGPSWEAGSGQGQPAPPTPTWSSCPLSVLLGRLATDLPFTDKEMEDFTLTKMPRLGVAKWNFFSPFLSLFSLLQVPRRGHIRRNTAVSRMDSQRLWRNRMTGPS